MEYNKVNERTCLVAKLGLVYAKASMSLDTYDECSILAMLLLGEGLDAGETMDIPYGSKVSVAYTQIISSEDWKLLTIAERMHVIGDQLCTTAKYWIREERHPENPSKPGDLA